MIELTEEELRTARLWCGLALCLTELNKQGQTSMGIHQVPGLHEFALSDLGRRVMALGGDGLVESSFERLVKLPVREALGIKKL